MSKKIALHLEETTECSLFERYFSNNYREQKKNINNCLGQRRETKDRSSHETCSLKKLFLEIPQNSQENTCGRVSFLIKLKNNKKETLEQVFSCKFCEFSENTFSTEHLPDEYFFKEHTAIELNELLCHQMRMKLLKHNI